MGDFWSYGPYQLPHENATSEERDQWWLHTCRALFEARRRELSEQVHPEIWSHLPYGHRLFVMREPPVTELAGIHIPDKYQKDQTRGWILTVGYSVNEPANRYPSVCPYPHPLDWVGAQVTFGEFSGTPWMFDKMGVESAYEAAHDLTYRTAEGDFRAKYHELTAGDIHTRVYQKEILDK